jgi:hypothetical protein
MSTLPKLPELRPNHYIWIIAGAYEHFAEKVVEYEQAIIRHSEFRKEANHNPKSISSKSREEEIRRLQEFLTQYRDICAWLKITHHDVSERSMTEDSVAIGDFIRDRVRVEPKKKAAKKTK